mgnify:CR=1 FL=1
MIEERLLPIFCQVVLKSGVEQRRLKKGVSKHHQAPLRHNPAEIVDTSFWQSDIAILLLKEFSI